MRDRRLERRAADEREELLGGLGGGDERLRPGRPADLPARERERLAGGGDRQRAPGHAGQRGQRDVLAAVEREVLVDLVGDGDHVALAAVLRDELELLAGEDLAGRVVRRVEQDQARARRERGGERGGVDRVVGRAQRDGPALGAGERDAGRVRVVVRLERDDLVALLAQREQRGGDRLGRAGRDEHLAVGVELDAVEAPLVLRDRGAQLRDAGAGRVLVAPLAHRPGGGLDDLGRPVGVGEPLAEVDRAGTRRERRHLGEDRRAEAGEPARQGRAGRSRHRRQTTTAAATAATVEPLTAPAAAGRAPRARCAGRPRTTGRAPAPRGRPR